MCPQWLRSISSSMGQRWARAETELSVSMVNPLSFTLRSNGHEFARATIPSSVTLLQLDKLIPCNRDATLARPMIDSLEVWTTPVRSIATRLEKLGRILASASPEWCLQPIRVSLSRRSQRANPLRRSSVRSGPWFRKLRRRMKRG